MQSYDSQGNTLKTVKTTYQNIPNPLYGHMGPFTGWNVPITIKTLLPNGKQTETTKTYDAIPAFAKPTAGSYTFNYSGTLGEVTDQDDYDYGVGGPSSSPLRKVLTSYQAAANSNYLQSNLLDLTIGRDHQEWEWDPDGADHLHL